MIFVALAAALLAGQAFVLGRAWLGPLAPDPMVLVATFLALTCSRRRLLVGVIAVGWVRALVLVEPAGGQVLCAWGAMYAVASLGRGGQRGPLFSSVVLAAVWWCCAWLVRWASGVSVLAGQELFLGVIFSVPVLWALLPSRRLHGATR
ncbi:MAG: hypothetical protein ACI9EF_002046 [Pseudohongiellaceae bacterium]